MTVTGRNTTSGATGTGTFRVFATDLVGLADDRTIDAVILPAVTDRGIMHVFDVTVAPAR